MRVGLLGRDARATISAALLDLQSPVRIVVCVEGGAVQAVLVDQLEEAEVILVDWDEDEPGYFYPHSHIAQMHPDVAAIVDRVVA